jgi:hypothetical protein
LSLSATGVLTGYRWRFRTGHARVGRMTMRDLLSLVAVVVGMLLVLAAA